MALTLTISGVNFLPQYLSGTAQVTNLIQNQGDTMQMTIIQKAGQPAPNAGGEIIFKDGSRFLFGGFITQLTPTEHGKGAMIEWQIEATDYTYILINKSAQSSYVSQTLAFIVNDLVSTNVDAGYSMSTAGVATGPTITTIGFNHITLRKCFENLAALTGYIWYVDYAKVVHFFSPTLAPSSPEIFNDTIKNHQSVTVSADGTQVRNDITVLGGTQESNDYTENILGDAVATSWVLSSIVVTMVSISLNGVSKAFGVGPADADTGNYFMWTPSGNSIRLAAGSSTPGTSDQIEVVYTRALPIIVEVKDPLSISALAAIEGGDGIHSYTITDTTIVSLDQARAEAQQELALYSVPLVTIEVVTRTSLLTNPTHFFAAGQAIQAQFPSWGINALTTYIIQQMVTTLTEGASGAIEYYYDITFGGRLLGVTNFLQALAEPETPVDISGEVSTVFAPSETITVVETFLTGTDNTEPETMTVSESFVDEGINFGTIFVTGPWTPSGMKRVFILNGSRLG